MTATDAPVPRVEPTLWVRTADGVRIACTHRPATSRSRAVGVVLAHGITGGRLRPGPAAVMAGLAEHVGVIAFDARGHGESGGECTLGDREVLDVEAVVALARDLGYEHVVTCGWSMGGSTVLRHAALHGDVDGVVSVSATSRWQVRDTFPMRRLHWLVLRRPGRFVARRWMRTRLADAWEDWPESPLEVVARVAPIPLLVVHGDRDPFFSLEHPRALAAAALPPVALWVVPGFGHAEAAVTPDLLDRLGRAIARLPGTGSFAG